MVNIHIKNILNRHSDYKKLRKLIQKFSNRDTSIDLIYYLNSEMQRGKSFDCSFISLFDVVDKNTLINIHKMMQSRGFNASKLNCFKIDVNEPDTLCVNCIYISEYKIATDLYIIEYAFELTDSIALICGNKIYKFNELGITKTIHDMGDIFVYDSLGINDTYHLYVTLLSILESYLQTLTSKYSIGGLGKHDLLPVEYHYKGSYIIGKNFSNILVHPWEPHYIAYNIKNTNNFIGIYYGARQRIVYYEYTNNIPITCEGTGIVRGYLEKYDIVAYYNLFRHIINKEYNDITGKSNRKLKVSKKKQIIYLSTKIRQIVEGEIESLEIEDALTWVGWPRNNGRSLIDKNLVFRYKDQFENELKYIDSINTLNMSSRNFIISIIALFTGIASFLVCLATLILK